MNQINILLLLFKCDDDTFAIDGCSIAEVVPFIDIDKTSDENPYIAGHIVYRGQTIPVVDFASFTTGRLCKPLLSSRIIIVKLTDNDQEYLAGIAVEQSVASVRVPISGMSAGSVQPSGHTLSRQSIKIDDTIMHIIDLASIGKIIKETVSSAEELREPEQPHVAK